jgi:putative two-component system response regulator
MSHYSRLIAQAFSNYEEWSELIFNSAPMHDVGKIGIPDGILLKPAQLSPEEWQIMRQHPEIGANILGNHSHELMSMSCEIALSHHEKWDGSGYPRNLAGEDIPVSARIIAIADVFDALTTERPYKKSWAISDALSFVNEQSGKHFDPALIECFNTRINEILLVKEKYEERPAPFSKMR